MIDCFRDDTAPAVFLFTPGDRPLACHHNPGGFYFLGDSMRKIPVGRGMFSLVDDDVYGWAKNYAWHAVKNYKAFYVEHEIKGFHISLHQCVMGRPINGLMIDHINGDGLDNRRENLRMITHRQNQQNRISHRKGRLMGTTFSKLTGKWLSRIQIKGKGIHLGSYPTERKAHKAYTEALDKISRLGESK